MKPLKTLHIDSERLWGGGQRQVAGLCTHLRDWGHQVQIVCQPGSKLESWAREVGIESFPVEMKSTLSISSVLRLRSVMARERPDIVHLHASRAHVLGSAAARLAGVKAVVATRRMNHPIRMLWPNTSAYGTWTTAIVAISDAVRDVMVDCGVDPSKIRLIPSGTDIARFENAEPDPALRSKFTADMALPLVCVTATLAECKGVRYLIEAAAILKSNGNPVHLIIAGDGDQRANLEQLTRDLGVSASFIGFCPDMPPILASIDVFAMPSLSEGLGVAVLEAMAAGKPVVASAVGGLKESVVDGVTGFSIPPRDSQALADGIAKLVSNPTLAAEFGSAGRARARAEYSLEYMARSNEALYYELVDNNQTIG